MFLQKYGASKKYRFDEIYSALQKSMRRNLPELAVEMGKEFKQYPGALRKRLVQNCCEDIPNLFLINDIYNLGDNYQQLVQMIPTICAHVKCREALYGFRVACQTKIIQGDLDQYDDFLTMLCKVYRYLCENRGADVVEFFQQFTDIRLSKIYNFINKDRTFLYMLVAWIHVPYVTNEHYQRVDVKIDMTLKPPATLPLWVYDKHVGSSPQEQKSYKFFIDNCILSPRQPETDLERRGRELYLLTSMGSGPYIHPIINCFNAPKPKKLLQTQLITARYKPRTWFCMFRDCGRYTHILKGPYTCSQADLQKLLLPDQLKVMFELSSPESRLVSIENLFYIVSKNMVQLDPPGTSEDDLMYNTRTVRRTSKLESTIIYAGNIHALEMDGEYTPQEELDLLKVLCFRKIIGTNDTTARNILYYNHKFTSIDDPVELQETPYMFKTRLNKQLQDKYQKMYECHKQELNEWLKKCYNTMQRHPDPQVKKFATKKITELFKGKDIVW